MDITEAHAHDDEVKRLLLAAGLDTVLWPTHGAATGRLVEPEPYFYCDGETRQLRTRLTAPASNVSAEGVNVECIGEKPIYLVGHEANPGRVRWCLMVIEGRLTYGQAMRGEHLSPGGRHFLARKAVSKPEWRRRRSNSRKTRSVGCYFDPDMGYFGRVFHGFCERC